MDGRVKLLESFKQAWERVDEALYDVLNYWGILEYTGHNPADEIDGAFPFKESLDEQWHIVADYRVAIQEWVDKMLLELRKESE